jgi:NTE family protein
MKIGLALGGGAARGLAHIPMLEVFDELGIKPSVIAGTSIGAVMGAGYAAGMTARDIRQHAEALLSSRADAYRHVFRNRKARLSELVSLKGFGSLRIKGETLADVALPDHLPKTIEELPIPFKAVATDYDVQEERVITSGNLVQAVAASIAIPGIIEGPRINGHVYVDGGVVNPVPFDHVRKGMDLVVAIDVTGRPSALRQPNHSNLEVAIGSLLIMFHQIAGLRHAANPPDIYIEPPLETFNAMDFFKPRDMWKACEPAKEKLKRALDLRIKGMT